jgi:response regulator RpfG family c-di-GMP phosphodiesterase
MTTTHNEPQSLQLLCVDDEECILQSLRRLFMDEDFQLISAHSGAEGLALLAENPTVAVIVSDQRMPGMLGSEFLHACRDLAPDAVRILLTGFSDLTSTIDAINRGGLSRYLGKPWNDDELLMVVRDAMKQYTLILENRRLNEIVHQQNEELREWNGNLKSRVLQQTTSLRLKNEQLSQTLQQIKESYESMVVALAGTVKLGGNSPFQHASTVSELALAAARMEGMTSDELETIRIASLLHDIGKLGVPQRPPHTPPERMNSQDLRNFSIHAVRGQTVLDVIEYLRPAGVLIRHHHERFDGNGFPDKLAGDAIPLGSRIIAFADFIDNAVSGRDAITLDQALVKAQELGRTRLDPRLQPTFEEVAPQVYGAHSQRVNGVSTDRELPPDVLENGMTVSRNIYSGSGVLLLKKETTLDNFKRAALLRYYELDPVEHGVFVKVEPPEAKK